MSHPIQLLQGSHLLLPIYKCEFFEYIIWIHYHRLTQYQEI